MDYVYDIEFYSNFFCCNLKSFPDGEEKIVFEISERRDDRKQLLEFLKTDGLRLIGFNNVAYDYPVLHMLIENPEITLLLWWKKIQKQLFGEERWIIWDDKRHVFQIDLFKINHYDNSARMTSLKYLEFTQKWHKVQDLPLNPHKKVPQSKMGPMIAYCWNDVDFTFEFAKKCWNAVLFRERMSKVLDRNIMDFSDVKIGEYLNQKKYMELTGKEWKDFGKARTYRHKYPMENIIPDSVSFFSQFMRQWLKDLRKITFTDADPMLYNIVFNNSSGEFLKIYEGTMRQADIKEEQQQLNTIITFGKGGLHSIDMARVVNRKEGWVLMEKDVGSMYPRAIVVDNIYPQHLGQEWNESISSAYDHRLNVLKPKLKELEYGSEEWNMVNDEQAVYKLAMNGGGFGKLGSSYSWQYDPLAKYRVTMGCELKLWMLIEAFVLKGIEVVSVNTDGVVIHYPKTMQKTVDDIHKWWEEKTNFLLEDTHYRKLVFSSVNDYLAVIVDPKTDETQKIKFKGDFEIDKDPHKNISQRIVPIALYEYFVNGEDPMNVVKAPGWEYELDGEKRKTDIFDFCLGRKSTRNCEYLHVHKGKATIIADKVVRYFISKEPSQLLKRYTGGKSKGNIEKVNAGFNITMFMDYFPATSGYRGDYSIDKLYYLNECRKIIKSIEAGTRILEGGAYVQGSLF